MKILFVWTGVTSYMADLWRALSEKCNLKVIVVPAVIGREFDAEKILAGIDAEIVPDVAALARSRFRDYRPDVAFLVGWRDPVVRAAVKGAWLGGVPKVCCFDMPWERRIRKFAAKFVLGSYLRRFAAAYVPGKSAEAYARYLGFSRIEKGMYAIDDGRFTAAAAAPAERRGFLFLGRSSPEKGLDLLEKAYTLYRERTGDAAWELSVPGWTPPEAVPALLRSHGCLVVPSRFEPWGVIVAEAKAAGMKVIVSSSVQARLDLPCDEVFGTGDENALAEAMRRVSDGRSAGTDPVETAEAVRFHSASAWVGRVLKLAEELTQGRSTG